MNDDSESTSRSLSVRRDRPVALRQNSLVARGLRDIAQLGRSRAEELVARGDTFFWNGNYDRAIADYTEAIRLNGDNVTAYDSRGCCYQIKGELDKAIADHGEAIRIAPDFAFPYNNRGGCYKSKGELDKAIADYAEAIRLKPDYTEAYLNRGSAYRHKGQFDKAISDFNEAIRLEPDRVEAYQERDATAKELIAMYPALGLANSKAPWADLIELLKRGPKPVPRWQDYIEEAALSLLSKRVAACTRCAVLVANRTQTVFGVGNPRARLVFIGEAPGLEEDRQGKPFVGPAGQLLTDIITKGVKLRREDVYVMNTLCCRPPANRAPLPSEAANCRQYLDAQLAVIKPQFICCLGTCAAHNLLGVDTPIGKLRGRMIDLNGTKVLCTYHPAYLLRNPAAKRLVWEDIRILLKHMGLK